MRRITNNKYIPIFFGQFFDPFVLHFVGILKFVDHNLAVALGDRLSQRRRRAVFIHQKLQSKMLLVGEIGDVAAQLFRSISLGKIPAQAQQTPTQAQLLQAQYYNQYPRQLPRNLRRSPIPRILRVIAWVLIALCGIAAVAALVAGFFWRTYLNDRWFIYYDFTFILVAAVYLLAGFLSALPFFYWAKKLELVEEIRNLLRKDGY